MEWLLIGIAAIAMGYLAVRIALEWIFPDETK